MQNEETLDHIEASLKEMLNQLLSIIYHHKGNQDYRWWQSQHAFGDALDAVADVRKIFTSNRIKMTQLEMHRYVEHKLAPNDATVTVFYTNGETQSYRVIGVSSYSQHGKGVVCLKVDADFSDVFYFDHESFYIAEGGDVLTFLPNTDTPQTRISFDAPYKRLEDYYEEADEVEEDYYEEADEVEDEIEDKEQLYYCYSLRSRDKQTSTGELMYGYSWDGDYVTTFCYGREQLKKYLTADMKVVRVSLSHNCKPRHPLP